MKKIVLSLLLVAGFATFTSCSKETFDPQANVNQNINVTSPTSGGNYILGATTAGTTAVTVKWTGADFGYNAAVKYTLQIIKATATNYDMAGVFVLGDYNGIGTEFTKVLTQRQLNNAMLAAGGTIGASGSYKMRVIGQPNTQQATSTNGVMSVSQEVSFMATAYNTFDEFDRIYVPGNFGGASGFVDWTPSNAPKLYSANNNGNYEGFVWMNNTAPEFKFTPVPSWTGDKGESSSSGNFSGTLGTASNIKAAGGAGAYFFTVNFMGNAYTMTKCQIAIIGAATPNGWGTPTYLTYDLNPTSQYFRMYVSPTNLSLTADEFLIRLKDDWSMKMGTTTGNTGTVTATTANNIKLNGGNMKVPSAGSYKVVLDVSNSANYNLRLVP